METKHKATYSGMSLKITMHGHVVYLLPCPSLMENEVGIDFHDVKAKVVHLIKVKKFLSGMCQTRQQSIRQQIKQHMSGR